jgi:hypothetical protein
MVDRDGHERMTHRGFGEVVSSAPPRFSGASSPGHYLCRTFDLLLLNALARMNERNRYIISIYP